MTLRFLERRRSVRARLSIRLPFDSAVPAIFRDTASRQRSVPLARRAAVDRRGGQRSRFRCWMAPEGATSRQHLVEHCAKAEDVGPRVGGTALRLFRRHVRGRSRHLVSSVIVAVRRDPGAHLRDAEVEELGRPCARAGCLPVSDRDERCLCRVRLQALLQSAGRLATLLPAPSDPSSGAPSMYSITR